MTNTKWGNDLQEYDEVSNSTPKLLVLDEIKLNGKTGEWKIKHFTQPKNADGKYPITELGRKDLSLVIVRGNRRKLVKVGNRGSVKEMTGEYSLKNKNIVLYNFDNNSQSIILPELIMGEGTGFKSTQVMYVLMDSKLYRLVIKGLQSKNCFPKDKDKQNDYFKYIYSFDGENRPYMFNTTIKVIDVDIEGEPYFSLDFVKESEVSEELVDSVSESVKFVGEKLKEYDTYWNNKSNGTLDKVKEELPTVDITDPLDIAEEDYFSPDKIPF